jgi:hypothetical protein
MPTDDDELASFLFPIETKPEKKIEVKQEDPKAIDLFSLMSNKEESKPIAQVPNIPAEKKPRTPRLHYAHGKQLVAMEQSEIIERFKKANLRPEYAAFFLCVDYSGARSS